jgi:hypothetical protein
VGVCLIPGEQRSGVPESRHAIVPTNCAIELKMRFQWTGIGGGIHPESFAGFGQRLES